MGKHKINLYSTFSNLKTSIDERFNRKIKTNLWKFFSSRGSSKWHDILQDSIKEYNNTTHRKIGMKPKAVSRKFDYVKYAKLKHKFDVGDKVIISKLKHVWLKQWL